MHACTCVSVVRNRWLLWHLESHNLDHRSFIWDWIELK